MPTQVLGVDVDDELLRSWCSWLAPERQPFFGSVGESSADLSAETRDTFAVWRMEHRSIIAWHDEASFAELSRSERASLVRSQVGLRRGAVPAVRGWRDLFDPDVIRSQADGHRFVFWPSMLTGHGAGRVLARFIESTETASRHSEVDAATWSACRDLLPNARSLAGTFASEGSGPNCFGTAMALAGEDTAARKIVEAPFLDWLERRCGPGGDDTDPGTILVWSVAPDRPVHAAVTIGDGWALEKPSQCWWTPRTVMPVADVIRLNRAPGQRLARFRLDP